MSHFVIAAAQYDMSYFRHWDDYTAKLEQWVARAVQNNAALLVFPEYGSMELASIFGPAVAKDLTLQLHKLQTLYRAVQDLHLALARQYNVLILGASFPVQERDGRFYNRATLYGPEGILGYQDKLVMTRFENEQWHISPSQTIQVIPTDLGAVAVNICYDSEFPLIARQQINAGADFILVPSCTDTQAGFYRVRVGCQARALENQCYVIQSPTAGLAQWSEAVDINTGVASIYTPLDYGFPVDGLLAEGSSEVFDWVYGTLDIHKTREIRTQGQVLNYRDWDRQQHLTLS